MIKDRANSIGFSGGDLFACFAAAFIISSIIFVCGGNFLDLTYVRQYPLYLPILVTCTGTIAFFALTLALKTKKILSWALVLLSCVFSLMLVSKLTENIYFCIGLAVVILLVCKYVTDGDKLGISKIKINEITSLAIVSALVIAFTVIVFVFTSAKYKAFYHSAFDFGIFCQMFEGMAETGLPYTTIERSEYLSHFAVHFSPFFYLLLPGYFVFRTPLYLLVCQALGVALGAFPVRRICKTLGLSVGASTAAAAAYLLFPTMSNGCFYDFHENKFLTVLILWAVAFALEKNRLGTGIFCLLILTVKEDAFIYVLAICLWMFVTKRRRIFALIVAVFSVCWFFFACSMIELSGGEIMTSRFTNYVSGGEGTLFDAVRTCFIDIGFLLKEVFAGADTESFRELTYPGQKLEFVLWTCIPILFTPFLRKRPSELVLLLPLLVINLMPRWMYQFDVDFQYTYGTAALLFFSALLFLGERGERLRRFVLVSTLCLSVVFATALVYPKANYYKECYYSNKEKYDATADALKVIPEDASVTAYGYIVPHLWYVDDLHTCPEYYADLEKTEYYVVDTRYDYDGHTAKMYDAMGDDYEVIGEEGYIIIYRLCD